MAARTDDAAEPADAASARSGEPVGEDVASRAAEWMARLWSDDASEAQREACARWRAAHPEHERAWNLLQSFTQKFDSLPRDVAAQVLHEPAKNAGRRRVLRALVLTGALGAMGHALRGSDTVQLAMSDYSTRTGEIRELSLPDGSQLVLASATAIDVHFDGRERRILLHSGEIHVQTAHEIRSTYRPFLVETRQGTVQALGTRFTVRLLAGTSRVSVFEGAVNVRPARAGANGLRVDAGQTLSYSAARTAAPTHVDANEFAWTRGMLVAEDMRLADFVAELNRYRPGVLRCDSAVADLRVTGVFALRDTDRALANLALALPVRVRWRTRYWGSVGTR